MSELGRVLVVDDDPDMVEILTIILESGGYAVQAANGAREALACLQASPPDLILLDIMMRTDTEGLDFLRRLREESGEQLAGLPVVILSGIYEIPNIRLRAGLGATPEQSAAGLPVQGFLCKPPDPHTLLSKIAQVLDEGTSA